MSTQKTKVSLRIYSVNTKPTQSQASSFRLNLKVTQTQNKTEIKAYLFESFGKYISRFKWPKTPLSRGIANVNYLDLQSVIVSKRFTSLRQKLKCRNPV